MEKLKKGYRILVLAVLALFPTVYPVETTLAKDWFATPDPGGTCSRDDPCLFSQAVGVAQPGDSVYFKAGTYKNPTVNPYVVYLAKNLNLVGGWNGAPSGDLVVNPDAYPTILDGEGARRVIEIDGSFVDIAPKISGFTITNGNASGKAANCSGLNANGCGGGVFVYKAAAHIVNNKILNNRAHTIAGYGYGGGIHLEMASGAVIEDNLIQGNNASQAGPGAGGGLSIYGVTQSSPRVVGNRFLNNSGLMSGGASIGFQYNPIIHNNIFNNNSANETAGMAVFGEGTVTQNIFLNNQGDQTVALVNFHGTFEGNTLIGNNTNKGLDVGNGLTPYPRFFNNVIARSGNNAMSIQGTITSFVQFEHNTLVGKGIGAAIHIPTAANSVNLSLTNNIISGFPTGVDNNNYPHSKVNGEHTLFDLDVTEPGVNATFLNSLAGDPAFKNPISGDYHIRYTSPARDAGISIITTTQDIDGDPRPIGSAPDIGADEINPSFLYLPLIKK